MKNPFKTISILVIILALLSACNLPAKSSDSSDQFYDALATADPDNSPSGGGDQYSDDPNVGGGADPNKGGGMDASQLGGNPDGSDPNAGGGSPETGGGAGGNATYDPLDHGANPVLLAEKFEGLDEYGNLYLYFNGQEKNKDLIKIILNEYHPDMDPEKIDKLAETWSGAYNFLTIQTTIARMGESEYLARLQELSDSGRDITIFWGNRAKGEKIFHCIYENFLSLQEPFVNYSKDTMQNPFAAFVTADQIDECNAYVDAQAKK